jgi:UDP-N-acetylglucosamine/UDP-N-acetylgalactosamine diphosphorylase
VYESDRIDEFAPIKNATGVDSPESSRKIQSERAGRWLESMNVDVPRNGDGEVDAAIDLSPLTAIEPADLQGVDLPQRIAPKSQTTL